MWDFLRMAEWLIYTGSIVFLKAVGSLFFLQHSSNLVVSIHIEPSELIRKQSPGLFPRDEIHSGESIQPSHHKNCWCKQCLSSGICKARSVTLIFQEADCTSSEKNTHAMTIEFGSSGFQITERKTYVCSLIDELWKLNLGIQILIATTKSSDLITRPLPYFQCQTRSGGTESSEILLQCERIRGQSPLHALQVIYHLFRRDEANCRYAPRMRTCPI